MLETTLYVGAGEGETGRRLGRCLSPEGTVEPGDGEGLRPAQDLLSQGVEERIPWCHPPCEGKSTLWC